jgi:RNA polymerase sigma-70 factor (ECF subfamily)
VVRTQQQVAVYPVDEDLSQADDATLARALIDRHPQAPRVAWKRFGGLVRHFVRRSLGPGQDCEDVVQDVFATLFAKPLGLREPGAIRGFIVSVTLHSVSYERRRRRKHRMAGLALSSALEGVHVLEPNPESRRALVHFHRILDRVREGDRAAFVLRFVEGMEVTAVAAALETSAPTARRRFTRAYQRVSLLAERDPFLSTYLRELSAAPSASRVTRRLAATRRHLVERLDA